MTGNERTASVALERRCRETAERLTRLYGWRLDDERIAALAEAMAGAHAGDDEPGERPLEQTCCRLRFTRLYDDLDAGGPRAATALEELFQVTWPEGGEGEVRYGGYLF